MVFGGFRQQKTNPIEANLPVLGRKSEILSSESDNSGGVAGYLLLRVGLETS